MSLKFAAGACAVLTVVVLTTPIRAQAPAEPSTQASDEARAAREAQRARRERLRRQYGAAGSLGLEGAREPRTITRPPGSPPPALIAEPKFSRTPSTVTPPDWAFMEGRDGYAITRCSATDSGLLTGCELADASDPRAASWASGYARFYRLAPSTAEKAWLPGDKAEYILRWTIR